MDRQGSDRAGAPSDARPGTFRAVATDVDVREATLADASAVAPLLGELGYPVAADELVPRMRRMLARDDEKILIAERDGAALGLLALHVFPALAYDADLALIMALVVTEQARGLGVGRRLIDRASG